jgi:hypothetical protein
MKVTITLTDAQIAAINLMGLESQKDIQEFAEAGFANKCKSAVMGALKSTVLNGATHYKTMSAHMELPLTLEQYMVLAPKKYYQAAQNLGGRQMKPLDELVKSIIENKDKAESADAE